MINPTIVIENKEGLLKKLKEQKIKNDNKVTSQEFEERNKFRLGKNPKLKSFDQNQLNEIDFNNFN